MSAPERPRRSKLAASRRLVVTSGISVGGRWALGRRGRRGCRGAPRRRRIEGRSIGGSGGGRRGGRPGGPGWFVRRLRPVWSVGDDAGGFTHGGSAAPERGDGSAASSSVTPLPPGSVPAAAMSSPSRLTSTFPPDSSTPTRSPSRIAIRPARTAARAAAPAGSRTCFSRSSANRRPAEDRRVVEQHDVVDVAPGHRQRPNARERRAQPVGDATAAGS